MICVMRTIHRLEPAVAGRTRVLHRPRSCAADQLGPTIGPDITADFPEVIMPLVRKAES
jgi:hypothetical protein